MLRTLLVSLVALLALPTAALAADELDGGGHKDRTTEIMLGHHRRAAARRWC